MSPLLEQALFDESENERMSVLTPLPHGL